MLVFTEHPGGSLHLDGDKKKKLQPFFVVLHVEDVQSSTDTEKHTNTNIPSAHSFSFVSSSQSSFSSSLMWLLLRLHGLHRPALQVLHVVLVFLFLGFKGERHKRQ